MKKIPLAFNVILSDAKNLWNKNQNTNQSNSVVTKSILPKKY
ncbi:hypothetical protein ACFW04_008724 [Cataglyphis niger]